MSANKAQPPNPHLKKKKKKKIMKFHLLILIISLPDPPERHSSHHESEGGVSETTHDVGGVEEKTLKGGDEGGVGIVGVGEPGKCHTGTNTQKKKKMKKK
jgi:hypothetical protein